MPRKSPLKLEPKGDMKELKKLLKDSPVVILVVFANWCGHCQTMKKNIWDPMCKRKNVNANHVAAVESSVLESAGEEGKEILDKVEGFPTVLEVVNGKISKSLPPPRTVNEFEELVNNAAATATATAATTKGAPGSTPFPTKTVANMTSSSNMNSEANLYAQTMSPVQTQKPEQASSLFTPQSTQYTPEDNILTRMEKEQSKPYSGGGNLYTTMRNISHGIFPAGALTGLAMRGGRRYKKRNETKRKQKKSRKTTRKH